MYRVKTTTKAFSKPGINPTTKNGNEVGTVAAGFQFEPLANINGWLSILSNKWVMASACEPVNVPPPVDPPPQTSVIYHWRKSYDGGNNYVEDGYVQVIDK